VMECGFWPAAAGLRVLQLSTRIGHPRAAAIGIKKYGRATVVNGGTLVDIWRVAMVLASEPLSGARHEP